LTHLLLSCCAAAVVVNNGSNSKGSCGSLRLRCSGWVGHDNGTFGQTPRASRLDRAPRSKLHGARARREEARCSWRRRDCRQRHDRGNKKRPTAGRWARGVGEFFPSSSLLCYSPWIYGIISIFKKKTEW